MVEYTQFMNKELIVPFTILCKLSLSQRFLFKQTRLLHLAMMAHFKVLRSRRKKYERLENQETTFSLDRKTFILDLA